MNGDKFLKRDLKKYKKHTKLCLTLMKKESMTVTMTIFFNGQQNKSNLYT